MSTPKFQRFNFAIYPLPVHRFLDPQHQFDVRMHPVDPLWDVGGREVRGGLLEAKLVVRSLGHLVNVPGIKDMASVINLFRRFLCQMLR